MYLSERRMSEAASQIRGIVSTLNSLVADLQSAGVWSGADADRFNQEWSNQVSSQLQSAAAQLDAIEFKAGE